jgi:uncharacterized protein YdaU (DUF1376 family)
VSAAPYMNLYVGDYLADTTHLTRGEHGAYLLLLMAMWRAGGKLPRDDKKLARIALCTDHEWDTIMEFFVIRGGSITQKRLAKEVEKYRSTISKRQKAGRASAEKKANKNNDGSSTRVEHVNHKPEPEPTSGKEPPPPPKGGANDLFGDEGDPAEKPSRRKPKVAIPDGYPDAEAIEAAQVKAREAGADVDLAYQADRFRNWAIGKDARYADWPATWANWVARTIREAPKRAGAVGGPKPDEDAIWRRRVDAFTNGSKYWNTTDWGAKPGQAGCLAPVRILEEFGFGLVLPFAKVRS